ncbi:MAG: zinc metalloprotease HtpX [Chlamydia sp. 32-24]|nr:MAG: zinc metalloprotease HtpX [Chlamydia sp. 32-24]
MALAKRIILFLAVNFLVVIAISFITYFFNLQPFLKQNGLNIGSLAIFCLLWGMGGSLISLFLSKFMAKSLMGVQIIDPNTTKREEREFLEIVYRLSKNAGLPKMPEVGIYQSNELNAFATGPSRSNALVAVSSGLIRRMQPKEVEAVLGHEVTHIANGDMVTMTLLQGTINAFVMFFARIIAYVVSRAMSSKDENSQESGFSWGIYQIIVFVLEIAFMFLGAIVIATFSRRREYRADMGGARLSGAQNMIAALYSLKRNMEIKEPESQQAAVQALKISNPVGIGRLFASHPPLDERIERLKQKFRIN